jgi:hypothetical protein
MALADRAERKVAHLLKKNGSFPGKVAHLSGESGPFVRKAAHLSWKSSPFPGTNGSFLPGVDHLSDGGRIRKGEMKSREHVAVVICEG